MKSLAKLSYCLKKQVKAKEKQNLPLKQYRIKSLGYINIIGVNGGESRVS